MVIFKLEPEDLDPPPPYIEDEDYDVYLFYPSISTCVLVPVDGAPVLSLEATNGLAPATNTSEDLSPAYTSLASDVDSQSLDELDVVSCCLPPSPPTYSFVSDFVFLGDAELENAGYSRMFRAGLVS